MHFSITAFLTNQFVLMSLTVVTGMLLGKIKIGEFSLGTSGALFSGIIIGWFVFKFFAIPYMQADTPPAFARAIIQHQVVAKDFFLFTLIMFIAAVGLRASSNLGNAIKKFGFKLILLGFIVPLTGASVCYMANILLDTHIGKQTEILKSVTTTLTNGDALFRYAIPGVFTGALTSSPGLAAALEAVAEGGENAEAMVGFGYSAGYIPGVISVILAISLLPILFKIDIAKENISFNSWLKTHRTKDENDVSPTTEIYPPTNISPTTEVTKENTNNFSVLAFSFVCFVGYIIGSLKIHPGGSSTGYGLGLTGGVLISSLLFGYIGKVWIFNFRMDGKILASIRDLSLSIFLGIVGLRYGYTTISSFTSGGLCLALIAFIAATGAILMGFFIGRYAFKMNWIILAGGICGSMTSTPGLGAAIDSTKSEEVIIGYGASYPFALMGMVLFTILLNNLPS